MSGLGLRQGEKVRMHPLYGEAMALVETLGETRLRAARLASELAQTEYDLSLLRARIERYQIDRAGDERRLGLTAEVRERVFALACEADSEYRAHRQRREASQLALSEARARVATLTDRLNVILAAMRSNDQQ